jgi:hypothetical protein
LDLDPACGLLRDFSQETQQVGVRQVNTLDLLTVCLMYRNLVPTGKAHSAEQSFGLAISLAGAGILQLFFQASWI